MIYIMTVYLNSGQPIDVYEVGKHYDLFVDGLRINEGEPLFMENFYGKTLKEAAIEAAEFLLKEY